MMAMEFTGTNSNPAEGIEAAQQWVNFNSLLAIRFLRGHQGVAVKLEELYPPIMPEP